AWSHYRHSVRDGHEPLAFGEALEAEESRLESHHHAQEAGEPPGRAYSFHSYAARGRYHEQLARWFEILDRSRFMVRRSDELFANPERVANEVLEFLGLSPLSRADFRAHNVGSGHRDMPAEERARLEAYFKPHNERLYELLGWEAVWG
ncbi:MAG TPA: hypothetical protein VFD39_14620, partial [Trueperaceae bacterium]|nr:hypothetical protein [Trueperaceae bacterium]